MNFKMKHTAAGRISKGLKITFALSALFVLAGVSCARKHSSETVNRIVCLSPSGMEILYALDAEDLVVARTDFCDFPEEAKQLPSVGGFDGSTLSIESILEYKADFVYGAKGIHDLVANQLEQFGIKVFLSDVESINDIFGEIKYIAALTQREKSGEQLVQTLQAEFNETKNSFTGKRVFYELWNAPYQSAGGSSFMNDVIEYAGGKNIFADIKDAYPIVSEEAIVARNPEVVIISAMNGISVEEICSRPAWKNVDAVKNKRVYLVDADIFTRPGPRVINAVKELNSLLDF